MAGVGPLAGHRKQAQKEFLPCKEALAVARCLGLDNQKEWDTWSKEGMRPPNVPSMPNPAHKDGGWQGWGHWLGNGSQSSKIKKGRMLPFEEALVVARSLDLANTKAWKAWCKEGREPTQANYPDTKECVLQGALNPNRNCKDDGWGH